MREVILASDRLSVSSKYCFPVTGLAKSKSEWIRKGDIKIATLQDGTERHIVDVVVYGKGSYKLQMDCITGTLYRKDGSCVSSDALRIVSIRDEENAAKTLKNKTQLSAREEQW